MTDTPGKPAPGWYDDPLVPNSRRYWDGQAWTDDAHARDASADVTATGSAATETPPTRRQFMGRRSGVDFAIVAALIIWPLGLALGVVLLGTERDRALKVIAVSIIVPLVLIAFRLGSG